MEERKEKKKNIPQEIELISNGNRNERIEHFSPFQIDRIFEKKYNLVDGRLFPYCFVRTTKKRKLCMKTKKNAAVYCSDGIKKKAD